METICYILEIQLQCLTKPKPIQKYDGRAAKSNNPAIYPTLFVAKHTEGLIPLLIIILGQHLIILGRLWMKKHGILLDMIYDSITFLP